MERMSRTMRRMQILTSSVVIVLIGLLVFCGYLLSLREFEIERIGNRADIKLLKSTIWGDIRVIDAESRQTIFRYRDEEGIVLRDIEKLPNGEWKIIVEDVDRKNR